MMLTLHATSLRGRKAYKDDTGMLHLECTKCGAIKSHYDFVNAKTGFLNKRADCTKCKFEINREYNKAYQKQYRMKMNIKKAMAQYS